MMDLRLYDNMIDFELLETLQKFTGIDDPVILGFLYALSRAPKYPDLPDLNTVKLEKQQIAKIYYLKSRYNEN